MAGLAAAGALASAMRAVRVEQHGPPDGMVVAEVPRPVAGPGEVLIRVHATAINRADTLQRKGRYPAPPGATDILGLEAAGEVVEVGVEAAGVRNIGDRVMALLPGGGYAEFVAVDARHTIDVPPSWSMVQAASIPEAWLTAFQLLHLVGELQPNDTVLVHAGASGVGTAAIQLAVQFGATVYITAGSEEKRQRGIQLGASGAFPRGDFADAAVAATGGVDLVLDCVGGSYWQANAEVLRPDGRWVVFGLMGGADVDGPLLSSILRKRLTIRGTTLRARSNDYKAELIQRFHKLAMPHLVSGALSSVVDTVLPFEEVIKAHKIMEENKNSGKIVLTVTPTANEPVTRSEL